MPYLDHAATTPMLPEALEVMSAHLADLGNPSSLHAAGRSARRVVEEARERLGAALGARPSEIVLTGGGTEADNLAVKGLYWARRDQDPRRVRVLASSVEHHAVLDPVAWLGDRQGAQVEWLPVDRLGRVDLVALDHAIGRDPGSVALVSVMWANNEIGTVQPIRGVVEIATRHGIPVHSDAVQAAVQLEVDFGGSGLTTMAISGHKLGGPLGVGALMIARDVAVEPVVHGGGQERDVRSGTLDAPAIAGFAVAAEVAVARREVQAKRLAGLRDDLIAGVLAAVPDAVLNGDRGPEPELRLPANTHFAFPGCEGDALLMLLDASGIACSTGSACSAGVPQPSHVLLAIGLDPALARSSLRFSLGHTSTDADVAAVVEAIGPAVERARTAQSAMDASRSR
jgi:cysteine desulfurase